MVSKWAVLATFITGAAAQEPMRWAEIKLGMYRWILEQDNACNQTEGLTLSDIAGEAMRFVGHDFMSDFSVDGCLGLAHPENQGLGHALTQIYNNTQVCPPDISAADCSVLLSEVAMDVGAYPYGQKLKEFASPRAMQPRRLGDDDEHDADLATLYLGDSGYAGIFNMSLQVGRVDTPLGSCESGHPTTGKGLGGPPIGLNHNLNFTELWRVLSGDFQCDFNEENVVAIMGVHTVGRARLENTNISGFWVDPSREASPGCTDATLGCQPRIFDKAYYDGFFDMGWMRDETGMWRCIPDSMGVDVDSLDETLSPDYGSNISGVALHKPNACFLGSLRLPADMIIMFELDNETDRCEWVPVNGTDGTQVQSSCRLRETWGEVLEYAVDNDIWLVAFREAWVKMVTCGHSGLTPFPYMTTNATLESFYPNGSLHVMLSDGTEGQATCGGVCDPFRPATLADGQQPCFQGMLDTDMTTPETDAALRLVIPTVGMVLAAWAALLA